MITYPSIRVSQMSTTLPIVRLLAGKAVHELASRSLVNKKGLDGESMSIIVAVCRNRQ